MVKSGLDSLLKDYGVKLGNDFVVDETSYAYPDVRAVIPQYGSSPIVEKLSGDHIATFMAFGRSVQKIEPNIKNVTQSIFMQSTDKGWGETNFNAKNLKYAAGIDTKGPVPMAIACEVASPGNPSKNTRARCVWKFKLFHETNFSQGPGNLDLGPKHL